MSWAKKIRRVLSVKEIKQFCHELMNTELSNFCSQVDIDSPGIWNIHNSLYSLYLWYFRLSKNCVPVTNKLLERSTEKQAQDLHLYSLLYFVIYSSFVSLYTWKIKICDTVITYAAFVVPLFIPHLSLLISFGSASHVFLQSREKVGHIDWGLKNNEGGATFLICSARVVTSLPPKDVAQHYHVGIGPAAKSSGRFLRIASRNTFRI